MPYIEISQDTCKGCALCVKACPKEILKISQENLNSKGYPTLNCIDKENCIGCSFCALMCPEVAITVYK